MSAPGTRSPVGGSRTLRNLVATLAAICFEGLALYTLVAGAPWPALALHLAAAGLLAEGFWAGDRQSGPRALATAWFWAGLFPLFGVLGVAVVLWQVGNRRRAERGESWESVRRRAAAAALEGRVRAQEITPAVVPLVDALRDRDSRVRVSAIEALRDEDSRRAVRLLAIGRANDVYDVRLRAVESLDRLASRRLEEIAGAQRAVDERATRDTHERLARLSFEYAELALDSPDVCRSRFQRAVVHGRLALRAAGAAGFDAALLLLVARAHWRLGALERAEAVHLRVLEREPDHAEALAGLAELQFLRRDFEALGGTRARLRASGAREAAVLADSIDFWSGEGERVGAHGRARPVD